jgi:hypothetical protein
MKRFVSALLMFLVLPALLPAQSLNIEVLRPQFKFRTSDPNKPSEPSTFTTAWFATLALPIYKNVHFVGQVPFASGKLDENPVTTKGSTIGNPAFGLRFDHQNLFIDVGLRLPFAKNGFAGFIGAIADIDRQEAFVPDLLPLYGMIRTKISVSKFSVRPYGGATFNIRVERDKLGVDYLRSVFRARANDGELFVLYGGEGGFDLGKFYVGGAYSARTWVSSGVSFGTSSINQVTVRAKYDFGKVIPGALFRFPVDDILLDSVLGFYCAFEF